MTSFSLILYGLASFIDTLINSKYIGCWGYQMMKRPNSKSLKGKEGKFAEPVWIWKKK